MKTKSKTLFLLLISLILFSCKKTLEDPIVEEEPPIGNEIISGTTWVNVGGVLNGSIQDLIVYDSKLFIGGNFFSINSNSTSGCAYLSGSTLTPINQGFGGLGFSTFATNGTELLGGGAFSGGGIINCAKWNGTDWTGSSYAINSNVYAITYYNGQPVIGGYFTTYNSINYNKIAIRSGTSWAQMANGFDNSVLSVAIYNNELYAAGVFQNSGTTPTKFIAKWNGTDWEQVGNNGFNGSVNKLFVHNNFLYAAGNFSQADGINSRYIAKWDGNAWSDVGGGLIGGFNGAKDITSHNNQLFIGGDFDGSSSVTSNNVISWNGTSWSALGSGITDIVNSIQVFNGSLYAGRNLSSSNYLLKLQ